MVRCEYSISCRDWRSCRLHFLLSPAWFFVSRLRKLALTFLSFNFYIFSQINLTIFSNRALLLPVWAQGQHIWGQCRLRTPESICASTKLKFLSQWPLVSMPNVFIVSAKHEAAFVVFTVCRMIKVIFRKGLVRGSETCSEWPSNLYISTVDRYWRQPEQFSKSAHTISTRILPFKSRQYLKVIGFCDGITGGWKTPFVAAGRLIVSFSRKSQN